ncbi:hypothetical protein [Micromonospora craterilacus]|uniref:hypothetical protein n=1 Tax=Micromonospora craterilacus TaxID=1655439 RepID=UPI0011B55B4D|nr:hypothetical protein [Micromonospora craterilacus]
MALKPAHVRCPLYAALRDETTTVDVQESLAADWLASQPGQPLILVGQIRDYGDSMLAEQFPRAVVGKLGQRTGAGHRGPLLVAWPNLAHLAQLQHLDSAEAICVIEGVGVLQAPWLRAQRAIDLATGVRLEPKADIVPPVVAVAVRSLIPMLNGLSSSRDKPTVVDAFCHLKASGYGLDPTAVYEFALHVGADGGEASLMYEVATKLRAGHNFRRSQRLRADIVRHWEKDAAAHGGRN